MCVFSQVHTALCHDALLTSTSVEEQSFASTWANCAMEPRTVLMAGMKDHTAEVSLHSHIGADALMWYISMNVQVLS